jgi:hypothetical protein
MDNGRLFYSSLGLFEFQAQAVADAYLSYDRIMVIDRGVGKTVITMALACQLFEDGEIDLVVHVGQGNKLTPEEFLADWHRFTSLRVCHYMGSGRGRRLQKMLNSGGVDVLLTTYETGKLDLVTWVQTGKRRSKGSRTDGPLIAQLGMRDKRILWVFDEVVKFANRGSDLYQAYEYLIGPVGRGNGQLRAGKHRQRVIGMSANPMSSDMYEQSFNVARMIMPDRMPTIGQFEQRYTHGKDQERRNYLFRKEVRTEFVPLFESCLYRKRNTDADVRAQMPELIETKVDVALHPAHRQLYDAVYGIYGKPEEELTEHEKGQRSIVLRLLLGHPRALTRSHSQLTAAVVEAVGADRLAEIPSSKTLALIEQLKSLSSPAVVFTFYAETVLPEVLADLREAGFRVGAYTGSDAASIADKQRFKAGQVDVLLSSDAGAKGLNLPEARYVCMEASTPVLTADLRWVPVGQLRPGDELLSAEEEPSGSGRAGMRHYRLGSVMQNHVRAAECLRVNLSNGEALIVTPEHRMLVRTGKGQLRWKRADELRPGWTVPKYFDVWEPDRSYDAGWLAGLYEGEGWVCGSGKYNTVLGIAQNPGVVLDRLRSLVLDAKFVVREYGHPAPNPIRRLHIGGQKADQMRFLGTYQPERLINKWKTIVERYKATAVGYPTVLSVETAGMREIAVLETSTRTFFGGGYLQHNCEYESAKTFEQRMQRLGRHQRIDSDRPHVYGITLVAAHTIEVGTLRTVLRRNEIQDALLGDKEAEGYMTADRRKAALAGSRA